MASEAVLRTSPPSLYSRFGMRGGGGGAAAVARQIHGGRDPWPGTGISDVL